MTFLMKCDVCQQTIEARVEASCSADHHSQMDQPAPEIKITQFGGGPVTWKANSGGRHECSLCLTDRLRNLAPQLQQIRKAHEEASREATQAVTDAWLASRKPDKDSADYAS